MRTTRVPAIAANAVAAANQWKNGEIWQEQLHSQKFRSFEKKSQLLADVVVRSMLILKDICKTISAKFLFYQFQLKGVPRSA